MKATIEMAKSKVAEVLADLEAKGGFFSIDFVKKTGELRTMNCRFLHDHTRARYIADGIHHNCLTVYDVAKRAFRQINLETALEIRGNGNVYRVKGE